MTHKPACEVGYGKPPRQYQWRKGTSGNPAGRPAGSRNKTTLACEQLLGDMAEQLTEKAVELAMTGNINALRLCLERIMPPRKERCINLELRPITSLQDLPIQFQDLTTAVAEGRITPVEAESLSNILESHAEIMERVNLDRRIVELEAKSEQVKSYRKELQQFLENSRLGKQMESPRGTTK